jgi:uncharacterized membrane-anchored protein
MTLQELNELIKSTINEYVVNEKSVPEPYNRYKAQKMTTSQINRRDKIGKKMLKQKSTVSYFRDNYGDDWESWLWATATTIAMRGE